MEDKCDAIDLNLGCPQVTALPSAVLSSHVCSILKGIARKGHYGAFLLEETDLLVSIVRTLHEGLRIPVTCKIRLLPKMEDTLALCLALQEAGCSVSANISCLECFRCLLLSSALTSHNLNVIAQS